MASKANQTLEEKFIDETGRWNANPGPKNIYAGAKGGDEKI